MHAHSGARMAAEWRRGAADLPRVGPSVVVLAAVSAGVHENVPISVSSVASVMISRPCGRVCCDRMMPSSSSSPPASNASTPVVDRSALEDMRGGVAAVPCG